MNNVLDVIASAKDGDALDTERLLQIVQEHHWPRVARSFGRSLPGEFTDDDLKQEFLVGVWRAIHKVDMEIGNPLSFLLWKGRMHMIDRVRHRVVSSYTVQCTDCGHHGRFRWRKQPTCPKCGSTDLDIWKKRVSTDDDGVEIHNVWSDPQDPLSAIEEHEFFMEIRAQLSGRVRDLFDALIVQGINRETSDNYLAEIADLWGCSTTNVARTLKRLQRDILFIYQAEEASQLVADFVLTD